MNYLSALNLSLLIDKMEIILESVVAQIHGENVLKLLGEVTGTFSAQQMLAAVTADLF